MDGLISALTIALAMGVACAVLSVFVVLRHWAFIGEGIAHAGFGGAGTAWVLALVFPSVAFFRTSEGIYIVAIAFCLCIALGIATVTRRQRVYADTAIGIFMVASLAWGFAASRIYAHVKNGIEPAGWGEFLFGQMAALQERYVIGAVVLSAAVVVAVALLGKEILYYSFDPKLAEVSGVRVGFVHYLLMLLLAVMIIIGLRVMGSVLVTALLVLPGATALLVTKNLRSVLAISIAVGLIGAIVGPIVTWKWPYIPAGPPIVLALVVQFLGVYVWKRMGERRIKDER